MGLERSMRRFTPVSHFKSLALFLNRENFPCFFTLTKNKVFYSIYFFNCPKESILEEIATRHHRKSRGYDYR